MRKEKRKMKMPEYGTEAGALDWSESNTARRKDGPSEMKLELAKTTMKSTTQKLHQSTCQKSPVIWYGYNDYMAHH